MKNEFSRSKEWWDLWFLNMAKYVSTASRDPSTQTGAVIVRPDKSVASVGFNGFPANMNDDPELYNNREEKYLRVVHCEINSLLFAPERVKGYTLYTYPFASCSRCAVEMLQSGISRFVFPKLQDDKIERWGESLKRTISYFDEAKVEWSEYDTI